VDFETRYTPERERERASFRREFVNWLTGHVEGVGAPPDAADLTYEQFQRNRAFLRALGERGWYAPTWPKEYGGGGLPQHVASIIKEELDARVPHLENVHPPGDIGGSVAGAVWHVGTDEQKRRFLPPILRGEAITWELHTEPDAGSDLPSLRSRAVREGDEYVISGTKTFAGGHFESDFLFFLAVTDPTAPRRENLSVFLIPSDSPGITTTDLDMIAGSLKRHMILEDVRVPSSALIGREGDGWTAFTVGLMGALTVGIGPNLDRDGRLLDQLLDYWRVARRDGRPEAREVLAQAYIDFQVQRLFRLRNDWLASTGRRVSYESAQVSLGRKLYDLRLGDAIHRALGPVGLVSDPAWSPAGGDLEYFHRYAILMAHPGGTVEIQKLRMFRGMTAGDAAD
jgi:alkylation response protein AidB-like acyl-CoA dehydrogenase